jgi:hypothetical protein
MHRMGKGRMAMLYVGFFLALVLIPFFILVAMPSWRWLMLASLLMGAGLIWLGNDVTKAMLGQDAFAPVLAPYVFLFVAAGAALGFVTRAFGLEFRDRGVQIGETLAPWYGTAVLLFAFAWFLYVTS